MSQTRTRWKMNDLEGKLYTTEQFYTMNYDQLGLSEGDKLLQPNHLYSNGVNILEGVYVEFCDSVYISNSWKSARKSYENEGVQTRIPFVEDVNEWKNYNGFC